MKNKIFGIVLIAVFMLVGSNDISAQKREVPTAEKKQEMIQQSRTQNQLLMWQKRLGLTDDQVSELEPVLGQYIQSIQELKANDTLSDSEKKSAAAELRKEYDAQFRTYLTEAQQAKFDELRGKRKQLKAEEKRELKAK